ncbi:MAG: Rrf2 family transcriptional regulator [Synergistaceae bacterium]|jgi:Rrf2 family protein|nr:Rrf2 family transcriptional regulator [Synergistaceae bacterium]
MSSIIAISEAASLALHSMAAIAREGEGPVSLGRITASTGISSAHLAKVLQRLVKAGLLHSTRGPRGGFEPARPIGEITLLEVYEAIEGPLDDRACLLPGKGCPFRFSRCLFGDLIAETNKRFRDYLSQTTIQSLLED